MPLLDLKTNLKSLKYGKDRPGGGASGQPFMKWPFPEEAPQDVLAYYESNRSTLDFPMRGGAIAFGTNGPYTTETSMFDVTRISRFLKAAPRGPIFLIKQQALQLTNPKIQVGAQINLALGAAPFYLLGNLENTRIYNNGANTLAQIKVQGSGMHFDRHGNIPVNPYQTKYEYITDERLEENKGKNRLEILYRTKIQSTDRISLSASDSGLIKTLNDLGISRNPDLLFQYPGGPTSVGGIGLTTINRRVRTNQPTERKYLFDARQVDTTAERSGVAAAAMIEFLNPGLGLGQTALNLSATQAPPTLLELYNNALTTANNTTAATPYIYRYTVNPNVGYAYKSGSSTVLINRPTAPNGAPISTDYNAAAVGQAIGTVNARGFGYAYDYQLLKNSETSNQIGVPGIKPDFRRTIIDSNKLKDAGNKLASTIGYETNQNLAVKYGIGDPGTPFFKRVNYNQSVNSGDAPINTTQDKINMLDVGEVGDALDKDGHLKDLVTFRFDTIEINQDSVPIVFRAFLNGIQDNHSAEYAPFRYVGRGENFYVYNGFSRQLSFGFKVAAQSRAEMRPLYRKVAFLLSQLYPDYKAGTGFMRAPLIKLTIGDYIYNQPGFMTNISVTLPDDTPWEIVANQIDGGGDEDMYQLPHMLDLSCQFTPIHDFLPRRSNLKDGIITPLITPNTPGRNKFGIEAISADTRAKIQAAATVRTLLTR